jgi:CRP/FNR family transcriptional regulator, cyclic AMP receptor protein
MRWPQSSLDTLPSPRNDFLQRAPQLRSHPPEAFREVTMAAGLAKPCDPRSLFGPARPGRSIAKYRKDQVVFEQGDDAGAVFYIQKGKVKIVVVSEHGKEAVLAILDDGDFFGEASLTGQQKRAATATALTDCTVWAIDSAAFASALEEEPAFATSFLSYLLARNRRIEEDLIDHLFNSSEKRLARHLLLLAKFPHATSPEPVISKISQETLAEMVGTTRSRVNFFMNKFRRMGFIEYSGHNRGAMRIHSSLLNVVLKD